MEGFVAYLVANGPLGMFIAAFLAGSFIPFNSETVMLGFLIAGADPVGTLFWGTVGNVLGSLFNYYVGSLGKEEWIVRYTKVSPEKLERGKYYVHRYGAWAGLLGWVPLLGSVVTVALGFLRVNVWLSMLAIAIGKYARYQILVSIYLSTQ